MTRQEDSLRNRVFNYCRDHPWNKDLDSKKKWCEPTYVAFKCSTKQRRDVVNKYINAYLDDKVKQDDFFKRITVKQKSNKRKTRIIADDDEPVSILPATDPGFEAFCRWWGEPGYAGLYDWQKEHHDLTWLSEYEMTLVPRDEGKTVQYVWKYEWAMQYKDMDILLLGWTDRRKEAAVYVYKFFYENGLIEKDKRTSPFHFRIKNGGKFDCYLITSKETLGMHSEGEQDRFKDITEEEWEELKSYYNDFDENETVSEKDLKAYVDTYKDSKRKLWIAIDDPIDMSFLKELHKERSLELHFDSSLYPIHPAKWSFTGTHKFEGDFFDFLLKKFEDEIALYKRSTMRDDGTPLCPEKFTHPNLPTYDDDLKEGKRCLATIRKHVGPYVWFAEYEQDPHPITGDIWDHVSEIDILEHPLHSNYDLLWITVDRATTMKVGSSLTGCLIGLRHMDTMQLYVTHDWTQKIQLEQLLIKINNYIMKFHDQYKHMPIYLIVETQGGGHDFVTMAKDRVEFLYQGKRVHNMIAKLCVIVDFHNKGEKIQRIKDRLYLPIRNDLIHILSTLKNSEVVDEILKFPYYPWLDAIDALANAEFELAKVPRQLLVDPMEVLVLAYQMFEDRQTGKDIVTPKQIEEQLRSKIRKGKSRDVFAEF